MRGQNIKTLTYGGLMTALVFVATAIIPQVPIPFTEGYIHTGDSMIFVTAILLGWKFGAIAGGLGSAMADLFLGYSHWVLPTLIIKGIMGAIVGLVAKEAKNPKQKVLKNISLYGVGGGWILLAGYLRNTLSTKLGSLANSELTQYLINDFELGSIEELKSLTESVQLSLTIAFTLIPVLIILLAIILRRKDKSLFSVSTLMGMTLAGIWMVIGYYFAGGILKGNMIVPIFSVPANIIQFVGGAIIAFPILLALKKTKFFDGIGKQL